VYYLEISVAFIHKKTETKTRKKKLETSLSYLTCNTYKTEMGLVRVFENLNPTESKKKPLKISLRIAKTM